MDQRLQQAAELGSTDELYALIEENPYILDHIDVVPFVNTPLHVAAASGNIPFAMEMLHLKPSFARKLNTSGYSPLHLAVENDQRKFVCRMLWLDSGLARVKGRNGITPFLFLVLRGDASLVAECLLTSPECIQDVSVDDENALHIAVMNDRFEVLQVLTGWIQKMSQRNAESTECAFLNKEDLTYNTALHLAAYKHDHQAIRLLLECRMMLRNKVNGMGLTFLDILRTQGQSAARRDFRTQGQSASGRDLDLDLGKVVLKTGCKEAASVPKSTARSEFFKSPITFWTYMSTLMKRQRSNASDEDRGVFLIVCALIITTTYQTALQPPGGVNQSENANSGSVVMNQAFFILLWVSNTVGFCCAVFYTFCLIPLGSVFVSWFFWIGTSLCISYALAVAVISPHPLEFLCATFGFFLACALYILIDAFVHHWRKHQTLPAEPRSTTLEQKREI